MVTARGSKGESFAAEVINRVMRGRGVAAQVDYWRTGYDWRRHEQELNELAQYTTTIDGHNVHFLHVRSPEPDALPLIITHGWPGSVAEFTRIIGPLTNPGAHGGDAADAFHVVAPSIPGFAFSGPCQETGWDITRIACAWAELMRRLGYQRYGAQGGDYGSMISPELARVEPGRVAGVHVNGLVTLASGEPAEAGGLTEAEQARLAVMRRWYQERSAYSAIQSTRPQTIGYGLAASPAGQLAWNAEWFAGYGDKEGVLDRDAILINVSIYWLTNTATSAGRLYKEATAFWTTPVKPSGVPTGVAVFAGDSSIRRFAERDHNVVALVRVRQRRPFRGAGDTGPADSRRAGVLPPAALTAARPGFPTLRPGSGTALGQCG